MHQTNKKCDKTKKKNTYLKIYLECSMLSQLERFKHLTQIRYLKKQSLMLDTKRQVRSDIPKYTNHTFGFVSIST